MSATVDSLITDLLAWLGAGDRPYDEVMDAWRTSCPRLPVWEEANERGLIEHRRVARRALVGLSDQGRAYLAGRH